MELWQKVSAPFHRRLPPDGREFPEWGAAINVLSRHAGSEVICVDIGVAVDVNHPELKVRKVKYGTDNFVHGPAMTREEALKALEVGIDVVQEQINSGASIFALGEMGIGNTTASSAILAVYSDHSLKEIVGPGTGIDAERLTHKREVIERAIEKIGQIKMTRLTCWQKWEVWR